MRHAVICLMLGACCFAENLPDAPSSAYIEQGASMPVPTVHWSIANPVWTKKFIFAHSLMLASGVYDAEITHQGLAHHRCVEKNFGDPYPSRGKIYRDAMLPIAAATAADWFMAKIGIPVVPYTVMPGEISVMHFRSGSRWFTHDCW
ncbi:MAG TPA: hypothetical protein VH088_23950 [Terriglobales bacterium]|jgi:hypothetical protein|nr:hypothetical protein [Terriglobales bacterium]